VPNGAILNVPIRAIHMHVLNGAIKTILPNGAIKTIFCQMGRLKLFCQMRRLRLFCQMGRSKLFCQMGRSKSFCQMGRLILLCQLGRYPDHTLDAFHASALTLSLVSHSKRKKYILSLCLFLLEYFRVINILN